MSTSLTPGELGNHTRAFGSGMLGVPAELPPGTLLGDWRVEAKIGEGGMGTVYAASHDLIGKRAALKVIRAEHCTDRGAAARLLQEARVVNQISHKNIVDIFYAGELPDGRPFLVMELLSGKTLADRLSEGRLPAIEAIDVLLQVCNALGAAHSHGVIHRDLKPDNIVLADTHGGTVVKLLDWGIAKLTAPEAASATGVGTLIGTPRYIAPEQARGKRVGEKTDIYSLGAIAYELFLESPPFTADNVADLLAAHLREPVVPPREVWPDIPEELDRLLLAMLAKDPAERPPLDDVVATLSRVRADLRRRSGHADVVEPTAAPAPMTINVPQALEPVVQALGDVALADTHHASDVAAPPQSRAWRIATAAAITAITLVVLAGLASLFSPGRRVIATARTFAEGEAAAQTPPATATTATTRLDLRFTPEHATVLVDGTPVAVERGRVDTTIAPGTHTIELSAAGFETYRRSLEVGPGALLLAVDLDPVTAPAPSRRAPTSRGKAPKRAPRLHPDATIDPFR
jgi:tRNA A-37 threonylcarbamoyl transferase component Bud32